MKAIVLIRVMLVVLAFGVIQAASTLEVGKPAPEFTLEDTAGDKVSLRQFRGQKLVLIEFIGAVWAPTCSDNVKDRGFNHQKYKDLNVQVIGISSDNRFALKAFADSVQTPFPLLSDPRGQTIQRYGVLAPEKDRARALRAYFLVDQQGILRKQWLLGLAGDDMVFSSDPILAAIQEIAAKH